ncbi:MAG: Rossmann-like domain-containing protein [Methanomassiliicoccales archaeon]
MELRGDARKAAIIGPSTPLTELPREHGAHLLMGMVIHEPERCMRAISRVAGRTASTRHATR